MGTRKFNLTDKQQQHILNEKHVSKKVPHFIFGKDSSLICLQFPEKDILAFGSYCSTTLTTHILTLSIHHLVSAGNDCLSMNFCKI